MPYSWSTPPNDICDTGTDEVTALRITAHNSLSPQGFVWFFGITGVLMCVPLMAFWGLLSWWVIFGYLLFTLGAAWFAVKRSWYRGTVSETLTLWHDRLLLVRYNPDHSEQSWDANPYWVRVKIHQTSGPVPHYITLEGAGRTVEIGAFLSEQERHTLAQDLENALSWLRQISPTVL